MSVVAVNCSIFLIPNKLNVIKRNFPRSNTSAYLGSIGFNTCRMGKKFAFLGGRKLLGSNSSCKPGKFELDCFSFKVGPSVHSSSPGSQTRKVPPPIIAFRLAVVPTTEVLPRMSALGRKNCCAANS